MIRSDILDTARIIAEHDTEERFSIGETCYAKAAELWNVYFGDHIVDAHDVAVLLALFETARIRDGARREDYIDACGFLACAGEFAARRDAANSVKRGEAIML